MSKNFHGMILSFDDGKFDIVMKHVGRLGNAGIVFAGSAGLIKYSTTITTFCPAISTIAGIIGLFGTFVLLTTIGVGAYKDALLIINNQKTGHVFGTACLLYTLLLGLGGIFVAIKAY